MTPLKSSCVVHLFTLFGICPVDIQKRPKVEFLMFLMGQLNTVLELFHLYVCYDKVRLMFDNSHKIGQILDVLQIVAPMVTHLVCIFECLYQRRRVADIWRDFLIIFELSREKLQPILVKNFQSYFWMTFIFFGLSTATEVWILSNAPSVWFRSRMIGQWAFMACRAIFLLYILHVVMIESILQMIAEELRQAANSSKSQTSRRVELQQRNVLKSVEISRKCYEKIVRISLNLSDSFGWSIIFNLLSNFLAITISLYYNYRRVTLNVLTLGSILAWIPLVFNCLILFYSCEKALRPMKKIIFNLHRIERNPKDLALSRAIVKFSCQLQHQKVIFQAKRFITIDYKLLKGIIASISVYLMIVVQFMPQSGKNVNRDIYIKK